MLKNFDAKLNDSWIIHIVAISILLTGIWGGSFALGNAFFGDPFHHGEYVATLPSVLAGNLDFYTIHGAMDWLPAWIAQYVWGIERHFLPTMVIYSTLGTFSSLFIYFVIALVIDKDNKYQTILLFITPALAIHIVGIRDIFLILAIWLYFLSQRHVLQARLLLLEAALGMILAINLIWSFDRGIAGIAGIGLPCLILAISEKRYFVAMGSFLSTLLLSTWIGAFSSQAYVENFIFLLKTSSQWSYGYTQVQPLLFTILVGIPNGWILYHLMRRLLKSVRISWMETSNLLLLTILTILFLKIGINRADKSHVVMSLWMPALSFIYLHGKFSVKLSMFSNATIIFCLVWLSSRGDGGYWILFGLIIPVCYILISRYPRLSSCLNSSGLAMISIAIPLLLFNVIVISSANSQAGYLWMIKMLEPPVNSLQVNDSIRWISSEVTKSGAHCVFDLSNNGVINGVTGLPACTKYIYPMYATEPYEKDMIQNLQQSNPPVVIFYSTYISFKIDDNFTMHDRFPELKLYLTKYYPYEKCNLGYCLRYSNKFN